MPRKKLENDLLQPVKVMVKRPAPVKVRKYLLGLMEEAPFHVVACGGQDFPRINEEVSVGEDGTTTRTEQGGRVVELTDADVKLLSDTVANTVVVMSRVPYTIQIGSRRYRPAHTDRPLAEFIYMIPIGDMMPVNWRSTPKENMVGEPTKA